MSPDQYFWVSYTAPTDTTGDDDAPTLVSTYPADGATFVPTDATVEIVLTDDRTGVDVSSIVVRVEGVDVTPQCTVIRSGSNWIIQYTPVTGFSPEDNITVSVRAADINTVQTSRIILSRSPHTNTRQLHGNFRLSCTTSNSMETQQRFRFV
jgi:hypothetical protein